MISIERFMNWLNGEIKKLENVKDEEQMFIQGKYFEAVRIRATICQMDKDQPDKKEELEELLGSMCDEYCKYPNQLHYEQLMSQCEKCPLNTIKEVLEHD